MLWGNGPAQIIRDGLTRTAKELARVIIDKEQAG
jgi:hypothetical protein